MQPSDGVLRIGLYPAWEACLRVRMGERFAKRLSPI